MSEGPAILVSMKIRVIGGNKWQRALAYKATRFAFSEELWISERKKANSVLYIRIQKLPASEPSYGLAYHNACSSYHAKSYTIQINTAVARTKIAFLETLMHELVHIWQMANRNLLRYSLNAKKDKFIAVWRGIEYDPYKGYSKHPWERQAFRMEKPLTEAYLAQLR